MPDPPSKSWKIPRKQFHDQIAITLANDNNGLTKLAYYRDDPAPFISYVRDLASKWGALYQNKTDNDIIQIVTREIGRKIRGDNKSHLAEAFAS